MTFTRDERIEQIEKAVGVDFDAETWEILQQLPQEDIAALYKPFVDAFKAGKRAKRR